MQNPKFAAASQSGDVCEDKVLDYTSVFKTNKQIGESTPTGDCARLPSEPLSPICILLVMSTKSPCRLFVVFARDADVGVILRRGPSKWVQVIKWNTRRDTFEDGAWFHGRIYEHSCDVSPDGRLFVYLAAKQHRPRSDGHLYTWTAVSRPPWLHALALWSHPYGVYGGGRFDSNSHLTLWSSFWGELYAVPGHPSLHGLMVEQENYETPKASPVEIAGPSWTGRD